MEAFRNEGTGVQDRFGKDSRIRPLTRIGDIRGERFAAVAESVTVSAADPVKKTNAHRDARWLSEVRSARQQRSLLVSAFSAVPA